MYSGYVSGPELSFLSCGGCIPQSDHTQSPELTGLRQPTEVTRSRVTHYMCTEILREDVQYPVVCNTESLETASDLLPRIWVNKLFNTVNYSIVMKTMVYKYTC